MALSNTPTKKQNEECSPWGKLLTRKGAAQWLNVPPGTLEVWAHRGGGPAYVKLGRAVRYRESDLIKFVESQVRQNTSEA